MQSVKNLRVIWKNDIRHYPWFDVLGIRVKLRQYSLQEFKTSLSTLNEEDFKKNTHEHYAIKWSHSLQKDKMNRFNEKRLVLSIIYFKIKVICVNTQFWWYNQNKARNECWRRREIWTIC